MNPDRLTRLGGARRARPSRDNGAEQRFHLADAELDILRRGGFGHTSDQFGAISFVGQVLASPAVGASRSPTGNKVPYRPRSRIRIGPAATVGGNDWQP